jgi:hypothetical protein
MLWVIRVAACIYIEWFVSRWAISVSRRTGSVSRGTDNVGLHKDL